MDDVTKSSISLHNGKFQIRQKNKYGHLVPHPPPYLALSDRPAPHLATCLPPVLSAQCCSPRLSTPAHLQFSHVQLHDQHDGQLAASVTGGLPRVIHSGETEIKDHEVAIQISETLSLKDEKISSTW